jgi:hypothetical protein
MNMEWKKPNDAPMYFTVNTTCIETVKRYARQGRLTSLRLRFSIVRWMFYYAATIAFCILVLCTSALGQARGSWQYKNKKQVNGVETYTYLRAGWPHNISCSVYDNGRTPVKQSTVKRQAFRWHTQKVRAQKLKRRRAWSI